jgi:ABC-2 type transport system permease protein
MSSIFSKALWEQRHSLPGWGVGIALLILLESALWPSMRDMSGLEGYLAEFPKPLKELFAIDQMSTGAGFLDAELFSLMLPLMFLVAGVALGARLVAGEQEAGTLDLLLVTPLTTVRMLVETTLAVITSMALLGMTTWAALVVSNALFDLGVSPVAAAGATLAMVLLGAEFGLLTLVAGALTGRRGLALGTGAALALASYVLYVGGVFVSGLAGWAAWSPFHQALHEGALRGGFQASFAWLAIPPAVAVLLAAPLWGRRDL